MTFERLVGLDVRDEVGYQAYRAGMVPILKKYGGAFRYDFRISETLISAAAHPINRLFVIAFPNQRQSDQFFADPEYVKVRHQFFNSSVSAFTELAAFPKS